MCCACNKVIDIECMGESALKSHMKGEKHKRNTCATSGSTQSLLMSTFLHKVSSSCDQRSESTSGCAEASNDEFSVPPPPSEADGQSTVKLTEGCQGRGRFGKLCGKMTCCLLKFCGHCKRYLLTIRTSQTRKWGKFSKLCFRIV